MLTNGENSRTAMCDAHQRETHIEVDVSGYATGGVLAQLQDDGKWHPIVYHSESMSDVECNYKIYDKEMLAMIRTLEAWCHYPRRLATVVQNPVHPQKSCVLAHSTTPDAQTSEVGVVPIVFQFCGYTQAWYLEWTCGCIVTPCQPSCQ